MKRRSFLYFLIYPLLGPLVGFFGFLGWAAIDKMLQVGVFEALLAVSSGIWTVLDMPNLAVVYVFGAPPATAVGLYAATALALRGRSNLWISLVVALACGGCAAVLVYTGALGNFLKQNFALLLIALSLFSTLVLRSFERFFRQS